MSENSSNKQEPSMEENSAELPMGSLVTALPATGSPTPPPPPQSHLKISNHPYQSSPAFMSAQYQQSIPLAFGAQSQPFAPGSSQYYPYPAAQQGGPSVGQYQYADQGYRSTSISNPSTVAPMPPHNPGVQRPMQQGQGQSYQLPRYDYQQYPQNHVLSRAMPFPAYGPSNLSPRHPSQFVPQAPQYPIFAPPYSQSGVAPQLFASDMEGTSVSSEPENTLPRGPPRKPKQSGYALWVGNLPRDVPLEELKEFFAIDGLESLFLIRKSNCAFVNYKTEEDCAKALQLFNDRMFMNVRLVCRLRKSSPARSPVRQLSSSENSATPTPPTDALIVESSISPLPAGTLDITEPVSSDQEETQLQKPSSSQTGLGSTKDRYFIMKSLTKEDLAWSVTNKLWATQPHNEATLNDAFRNSENVFLIFSVNKSGEFFGYAKMASEINPNGHKAEAAGEQTSDAVTVSNPPVPLASPKTTVTPKTNKAPRGKIFEDDVRGTVFWEAAESSDDEDVGHADAKAKAREDSKWGNRFRVEWIKWDANIPFQRTRLLRNPWNGNREVKISRDGTELEPSVGARLLREFEIDPTTSGPDLSSIAQGSRRTSYPQQTQYRPLPGQFLYPQQNPMSSHPMPYVPYTTAPQQMIYGYPQARTLSGPPPPAPYGQPGQQYSYGQPSVPPGR